MLKIFFLVFMAGGIPVAIAMAGASLAYILMSGGLPPFVVIHRMVSGIDSFPLLAVPFFILAGNLMNNAGITDPHLQLRAGAGRLAQGRAGPRQRAGLGDLRRHERHRHRRRRRPGHHRDQGHEGARLRDRVRGGRDGRLGHAGADHPAEPALRDLRDDGQRVGGRAVPRGHPAGRDDGHPDDAHGGLLRPQEQVGRRRQVLAHAAVQGAERAGRGGRLAAAAVGAGRPSWARRRSSRCSRGWRRCSCSTGSSASRRCCPS